MLPRGAALLVFLRPARLFRCSLLSLFLLWQASGFWGKRLRCSVLSCSASFTCRFSKSLAFRRYVPPLDGAFRLGQGTSTCSSTTSDSVLGHAFANTLCEGWCVARNTIWKCTFQICASVESPASCWQSSDLADDLPNHPPEMPLLAFSAVLAASFSPLPLLALGQEPAGKKHQLGAAEALVKQQLLSSLLVQSCPDCPKPILESSWPSNMPSGPCVHNRAV